jgi:hypothetical protein
MTAKNKQDETKKSEAETKIESLRLVARGRVNLDFSNELNVISEATNVIRLENEKRFFDETLAHVCARVTKYVDSLELFDQDDQLIVKVTCNSVPREEVKISAKSTTKIYLDKVKSARAFEVVYLSSETNKLETEKIETEVREWKYRRDERRNEFISQLKTAINKVDSNLVALKQASTLSQEEIDLKAEIERDRLALKAKREALKQAKSNRVKAS